MVDKKNLKVKDVMMEEIDLIHSESTLQDAAQKMKHTELGALPVKDNGKLVGLLTDRDITIRAIAEGRDPANTKVKDIMTRDVVYSFEDQKIEEALKIMSQKQIRRLPVLDRNEHLVGLISLVPW